MPQRGYDNESEFEHEDLMLADDERFAPGVEVQHDGFAFPTDDVGPPDQVAAIAELARQAKAEGSDARARLRLAAIAPQLADAVLEMQRHMPGARVGKTYGTVFYDDRDGKQAWVVVCEPHVRVWLRRLFPKAARVTKAGLRISASVDRTADLEWTMQRYPMVIHPRALEAWRSRLLAHVERERAVDTLTDAAYQPPLFDGVALPLRDYQRVAADHWLRVRRTLVADDLGLGKTAEAIGALTDRRLLPAMVVTLTHLTRQWKREINRFLPGLRVHVLRKGTSYDLHKVDKARAFPDVVVCNYHKLRGWADALGDRVKSIVFDECQELRISDSDKYKAAAQIADGAEWRLGLSATPVYNYGSEVWTIFDVLDPGRLGTKSEFLDEWCGGKSIAATFTPEGKTKSVKVDDPVAFGSFLRATGAMLRRTRKDVGRELPALQQVVQFCESDTGKLDEVNARVAELARLLLDPETEHKLRFEVGSEIDWRMRQATGLAKAPFVADFVRLLHESGSGKVVLYGWHRLVYDVWLDRLKDLNPVMFTGSESVNQKDEARKRFIEDDECQLMIMSLRAGAGLDGLQRVCRTVVVGELDWSPKVIEQDIGRVHRDGQRDQVLAYIMVSNDGADPTMSETLGLKEVQAAGVIGQESVLFKADVGADHIRRLAQSVLDRRRGTSDE